MPNDKKPPEDKTGVRPEPPIGGMQDTYKRRSLIMRHNSAITAKYTVQTYTV